MTDPLERMEDDLPVLPADVMLGQDHQEDEEGGLAVGGSQYRGGAHQRSSTERLRGQLLGQSDLGRLLMGKYFIHKSQVSKSLNELTEVVSHLPGELVLLCGPTSHDPHQVRGGGPAGAGHAAGGRERG